jgi:predicted GH43/DUF377 family glycosyl hydrolase
MKWLKKGRIFIPNHNFGWMNSHAQIPTVLVKEDRLRVYFATRPQNNLGLTTFIDLDKRDPRKILYIHDKPILEVGKPGMFDNHGIFPSHVMIVEDRIFLYYVGWYRGTSIPYHNAVGLATSDDGGVTFSKMFEGPIVDRTPTEPYSMGAVYIIHKDEQYHMFYNCVFDWIYINNKYEPLYHIRHALSNDGIEWKKTGQIIVKENYYKEAVARPSILHRDSIYHMWFCYRGSEDFRNGKDSYKIGYAFSENLVDWTREDRLAGIHTSDDDWDSKMLAYPYVVNVDGETLMFYNGNGFGTSGFGYAIASWEEECHE